MFCRAFCVIKIILNIPLLYLGKYNRFFLKLISIKPIDVSLKVTENCNSRCITCNVWRGNEKKEDLSIEELETIFYQLNEIKIKTIGMYGGEPLLRKDIGEVIKRAKKIIKGVKILVITNGLLLKIKAKELKDSGVDIICVSLDGIGETNDKIRGIPGDYQMAVEGIKELKKVDKEGKVQIHIGTTLVSLNIHQVPQLINLARDLGTSWAFSLFDTSSCHFNNIPGAEDLKKIEINKIEETIKYISEARKKYPKTLLSITSPSLDFSDEYLRGKKPFFHCVLGYLRIYIDSSKNVYSGCWAMPPLGNLKEKSIKEIIGSQIYKKRIKEMYELKCPYCTCGFLINHTINKLPYGAVYFLQNWPDYIKYFRR
jgi:MoaA/NifB/PqqE/SkfB family radical SAM enzyme